jgi:5-methylcytosine-specific restriction endonuclease McrA
MLSASTIEYLTKALGNDQDLWSSDCISSISAYSADDFIFIQNKDLLQTDIKVLWANWFVNSFQDPYHSRELKYPFLYHKIIAQINEITSEETTVDLKQRLASMIASRILETAKNYRERSRQPWSEEQKKTLLDIAGPTPRCWITGYKFTCNAINSFIHRSSNEQGSRKKFLDYMTPIGLKEKDTQIQIDHAKPFASGGSDQLSNLRLSCGWANRVKSNFTSLYDAKTNFRKLKHPKLGTVVTPPALWIIRTLATNDKCSLCLCPKTENQLFVFPRHIGGEMNPINLKTYCQTCHPKKSDRLIYYKLLDEKFGD